ncbi:MAG: phosphate signaling complex PhoU family protein [Ferrimicrobium sp.]
MQIRSIDVRVLELFALVSDGFVGAKEALLHGDRSITAQLVDRERRIDRLYHSLQDDIDRRLLAPGLTPEHVHYLVTVTRIIPELERSGDLALHIAQKAVLDLTRDLSPRSRGILEQMAELGAAMWNQASVAFDERDAHAANHLDALDEELDELHLSFIAEVASTCTSVAIAMEMALVGRFFERFGDHAVNLARTTSTLARTREAHPRSRSDS